MNDEQSANPEYLQSYSTIAESTLEFHNAHSLNLLGVNPVVSQRMASVVINAVPYRYYSVTVWSGLLLTTITMTVYDWNDHSKQLGQFSGEAGRLSIGGGTSHGAAWFNRSIEDVLAGQARLKINATSVVTNVNLWDLNGEVIGSFVGSGAGLGVGVTEGRGNFSTY